MELREPIRLLTGVALGFILGVVMYQSSRVGNIDLKVLKGEGPFSSSFSSDCGGSSCPSSGSSSDCSGSSCPSSGSSSSADGCCVAGVCS